MKIKRVFFLWLFLAIVFSCVKTNAEMIKLQSRYLGFGKCSSQFYAEIYMPYSKEVEDFLSDSVKDSTKLDRDPDVVIVIDNINYYGDELNDDDEKNLLGMYNKILGKKKYVLIRKKSNSIGHFTFMGDIDKFTQMAKDTNIDPLRKMNWIASMYYDAIKNILKFKINSCRLYDIVWDIV